VWSLSDRKHTVAYAPLFSISLLKKTQCIVCMVLKLDSFSSSKIFFEFSNYSYCSLLFTKINYSINVYWKRKNEQWILQKITPKLFTTVHSLFLYWRKICVIVIRQKIYSSHSLLFFLFLYWRMICKIILWLLSDRGITHLTVLCLSLKENPVKSL